LKLLFDALGAFAGGLMVDTRLRLQRGQEDITANPARRANQYRQISCSAGAAGATR
jgi:hypothetical protein